MRRLADWNPKYPNNILLFTARSGHFYGVGEVLLDRNDPERAIEWLPGRSSALKRNILGGRQGREVAPPARFNVP